MIGENPKANFLQDRSGGDFHTRLVGVWIATTHSEKKAADAHVISPTILLPGIRSWGPVHAQTRKFIWGYSQQHSL